MELQITSSDSDLIVIQLLDRQQQNKILTAIVDKEPCLIVEIRDNKAHDDYYISVDVLGFATYYLSNDSCLQLYPSRVVIVSIMPETYHQGKS